ncbi:amino acid adenylation domain-containing protein [Streptomyces sp. RM1]
MNVIGFLEDLSAHGIRIGLKGDKLAVSAPKDVLTPELADRIRRHREDVLRFLREHEQEEMRRGVRMRRVDRTAPIPASYAQHRLWLVEQTGTDLPVYNMYFVSELHGDVDVEALSTAVEDVVRRHEVLRTSLVETESGLWQRIHDDCPVTLTTHEATGPGEADELIFSLVTTRFDLSRAPLIRFDLVRTSDRRWSFVVVQHHVISDGWSANLLKREISELYAAHRQGRPANLPELPVQYADYAVWERGWLGSELANAQREFWRDRLAGLPPALELVPARRRDAVQSYRGEGFDFHYGAETLARVRELCEQTGVTLYSALMAAYSFLVSRMTGQDDVAVGSPLANRPYPVLENTFGLFFNSITIRSRLDASLTVREFLTRTRQTTFEAFAHQDLPFDQVVQAVAPERSLSHAPVFQTIFILQSYPAVELDLAGVETRTVVPPIYSAQYDVMFKLRAVDEGLAGVMIYNRTLLDESDARRFTGWFEDVLRLFAESPDTPLGDLALASREGPGEAVASAVGPEAPLPEETVEALIRHRLALAPDAPALTFRGETVSRGELARRAAAVAGSLRAAGLRPGQRVGLLLPRTPDLVAVLLGVLRAGLVYVPLSGAWPDRRTEGILESAGCAAVVLGAPYEDRVPGFAGLRLAAADLPAAAGPLPDDTDAAVSGDGLAYVIFTSGSTGRPKGVEVSHANLRNLVTALDERVAAGPDTVWLSVTDVTFDIAAVELLWTLARGIPVVLSETAETLRHLPVTAGGREPAGVPELVLREGVTALQATPTFLRELLRLRDSERALGALGLLLVGGEPLDATLAARLKELGVRRVLNMYGPTETTVWSTCWEVPERPERILVGRPLANTTAYVVDAALRPVPVGMFGELLLGGAGVTRGYAGQPGMTEERFVTLPGLFADGPLYRTGDLARLLPGGDIELAGRLDHQVKVNGYRIELEEVEHALNSLDTVAASAVTVQRRGHRDVLVAHYVPPAGRAPVPEAALRDALAALLPDQMVPSSFVALDALPTTPGGKTDRRALPPVVFDEPGPAAVAATELEQRLLTVWRRVLRDDGIGPDDDFFHAGGTSLLMARLLQEVRAQVRPDARIVDLFRYPTVRGYAAHLDGSADTSPRQTPDGGDARRAAQARRRQQVARKRRERSEHKQA